MTNKNEKLRPLLKVEKIFLTQTTGRKWMDIDILPNKKIEEYLNENLHKPMHDKIKEKYENKLKKER